MKRIIIHVDANNAFLSWTAVEMLKNGNKIDIRNTYSVIGGDEKTRRGIVLAKSNLCKKKLITTGESLYEAKKKCPNLKVYPPDFKIYKKYSDKLYNYLTTYSEKIERYSIDECFIDYTDSFKLFGDPIILAHKIKDDIKNKLGFTVNIGIGNNKITAKMASNFEKPDRVHTLFDNEIKEKLWPLKVSELFMIGKSSAQKLQKMGIETIYDLAHTNKEILIKSFKSQGLNMWEHANGIDNDEVHYQLSNPKSISSSTVLPYDFDNKDEIYKIIFELSSEVGKKLRKNNLYTSTIYIWIKYQNFNKVSKQLTLNKNINSDKDIFNYSKNIFNQIWNHNKIRSICVGISNLNNIPNTQLSIFDLNNKSINNNIQNVIDKINDKFGDNIITYATLKKK